MTSSQAEPGLQPEWMDLKTIQRYACVSERTVRGWIHHPRRPLPAVQVERGKILIKRSSFDRWLESQAYRSSSGATDVNQIVDDVMNDLRRTN